MREEKMTDGGTEFRRTSLSCGTPFRTAQSPTFGIVNRIMREEKMTDGGTEFRRTKEFLKAITHPLNGTSCMRLSGKGFLEIRKHHIFAQGNYAGQFDITQKQSSKRPINIQKHHHMSSFYRRRLPHWQPAEATYFVTYRLSGSIPMEVIKRIRAEYRAEMERLHEECAAALSMLPEQSSGGQEMLLPEQSSGGQGVSAKLRSQLAAMLKKKRYNAQKRQFKSWDNFLDSNLNGPYWLQNEAVAQLNADAIRFYDGKRYKLLAFCIMSNHIHLLFTLLPGAPPLWKVMQDLKKYTAVHSNRLIGNEGNKFWEEESYDHVVRDKEFNRILAYILNNPVKAGLVTNWNDWPWTYCSVDLLDGWQ
jgi:putative transposase